jgi:16S rRNA (uracil1498-N3)-methyltransferase
MKRFILPAAPDKAGIVRLFGDDYHYLVRVKRFSAGSEFAALLPDGTAAQVRVRAVGVEALEAECLAVEKCLTPSPFIALFQALPKGAKMDSIVRQAVEGGVSEIVPFVSAYSVPKIADKRNKDSAVSDKTARWRRIVREAIHQSGSATPTAVHEPLSFDELLHHWEGMKNKHSDDSAPVVAIFLHPATLLPPEAAPVSASSFHACLDEPPAYVALAVGPEGGFSLEEAARFIAADFKPLDLGNTILRTETAAVYAVAAVRIILLERSSWILNSLPR